jgi:hypothetical protein
MGSVVFGPTAAAMLPVIAARSKARERSCDITNGYGEKRNAKSKQPWGEVHPE